MRPALQEGEAPDEAEAFATPIATEGHFDLVHPFVMQWEGGYVDHPRDKGGPTNMGVTQATLEAERGRTVTKQEVKDLTRAEADRIFYKRYFTAARCTGMPERAAAVVYNGTVLHGTRRSGRFLQRALNAMGVRANGKPLEVDGVIGRNTLAGVGHVSPTVLADEYIALQESYLQSHEDFDVFGAGWMNRMSALRDFVETLPQGAGARPKVVMKIQYDRDGDLELGDLLGVLLGAGGGSVAMGGLGAVLGPLLDGDPQTDLNKDGIKSALRAALVSKLVERVGIDLPLGQGVVPVSGVAGGLTPVNAALGNAVGGALNGKKTIVGLVGTLVTALAPSIPALGQVSTFFTENQGLFMPILSALLGWGVLGKIDKAIYATRTVAGIVRQS